MFAISFEAETIDSSKRLRSSIPSFFSPYIVFYYLAVPSAFQRTELQREFAQSVPEREMKKKPEPEVAEPELRADVAHLKAEVTDLKRRLEMVKEERDSEYFVGL